MNFFDKVTGNDMTRKMKEFDERIAKLPKEYKEAFKEIQKNLWVYSDFTGRRLTESFEKIVTLLEETASESLSIKEVFGEDIKGFCEEVATQEGLENFRDKWRKQLNNNIKRKLEKLGGKKWILKKC